MIIPPAEDPMLQLFTNMFTRKGHRQKAQRMTSRVLLYLHTFTRAPPLPLFRQAVLDAAPATKCASVRSGPKIIITPKALPEKTRIHLAIGAIMKQATKRGGQQIEEKIAREMLDILKGDSEVLKIKDRLHKEAFANRSAIRIRRS
ncbi:universal ribosomal protein uS7 family protein [Abortiporus biennis]